MFELEKREVIACGYVVRVELECFAKAAGGAVGLAVLETADAEKCERLRRGGRLGDGEFKAVGGLGELALLILGDALLEVLFR